MKKQTKKSQIWGLDLMAATAVLMIGLMIFFVFALNEPNETRENFESMHFEAEFIMNSLLSDGHPAYWDESTSLDTLKVIGLLTDDRINETKLIAFYKLTGNNNPASANYRNTQLKFGIRGDYHYYFILDTDGDLTTNEIDVPVGPDKLGIGKEDQSAARNLIKLTRFTIYQNKPATAYLYLWEE